MEIDEDELKDAVKYDLADCLDELTFVLSGEFEVISRDKLEDFIKSKRGIVRGSVSGKTNYLIVGYKLEDGRDVTQGRKYTEAKTRGIPIMTEKEFEQFIKDRTGLENFTIRIRKSLMAEQKATTP